MPSRWKKAAEAATAQAAQEKDAAASLSSNVPAGAVAATPPSPVPLVRRRSSFTVDKDEVAAVNALLAASDKDGIQNSFAVRRESSPVARRPPVKKDIDNSDELFKAAQAKEEAHIINERIKAGTPDLKRRNSYSGGSGSKSAPPQRPGRSNAEDAEDEPAPKSISAPKSTPGARRSRNSFSAISERQKELVGRARQRADESFSANKNSAKHDDRQYDDPEDEADSFIQFSAERCVSLTEEEYNALLDRLDRLSQENEELKKANEKLVSRLRTHHRHDSA